MSKKQSFYAVQVGRRPGVYNTWAECESNVKGVQGARHRKFPTLREAQDWSKGISQPVASTSTSSSQAYARPNGGGTSRKREADAEVEGAKRHKAEPQTSISKGVLSELRGRKVYCDGSALGNGKAVSRAGIGIWWGHGVSLNLSERLPGMPQTNNRAEMYAVARILETDPEPHLPLTICSDSEYTINVFSTWIPNWKRNSWRSSTGESVKNKDLIIYILALIARRSVSHTTNVSFFKVKAHANIEGNEAADRLAKGGAEKPKARDRDYERDARNLSLRAGGSGRVPESVPVIAVAWEDDDWLTEADLRAMESSQDFD